MWEEHPAMVTRTGPAWESSEFGWESWRAFLRYRLGVEFVLVFVTQLFHVHSSQPERLG